MDNRVKNPNFPAGATAVGVTDDLASRLVALAENASMAKKFQDEVDRRRAHSRFKLRNVNLQETLSDGMDTEHLEAGWNALVKARRNDSSERLEYAR